MTVADRIGSEQLEPWITNLYEHYGSQIDIDGVADVSMVPKPLHRWFGRCFESGLPTQ